MATQAEVAEHLFLTARRIRDLAKSPGAPKSRGQAGYSLDEWRKFYIDYLKGLKAGGSDELDPEMDDDAEELAALKREDQQLKNEERRENIELKRLNRQIKAKQFGPLWLISEAVSSVASAVGSRVDGWLPRLRQVHPDMPIEVQELLQKELVLLLNELANVQPDFSRYLDSDPEGDSEGVVGAAEESAA